MTSLLYNQNTSLDLSEPQFPHLQNRCFSELIELYLKYVATKEEQTKPKVSQRKEIIKITEEIKYLVHPVSV